MESLLCIFVVVEVRATCDIYVEGGELVRVGKQKTATN